MNGRTVRVLLWAGLLVLCSTAVIAQERWVYKYDGPYREENDVARSIVMGSDGNLYVAGKAFVSGPTGDFTVISLTPSSLTPSGMQRWVYQYDGLANRSDGATSILIGLDENLYAAGYSKGIGTDGDFTVISLTTSGVERWIYRYNGPGNDHDGASSIVTGSDGNLYAAGRSKGSGTDFDFVVISLTTSGAERWVYRYNGPVDSSDAALTIAVGPDNNIYAAGYIWGDGSCYDFAVISLTPSGAERWIYQLDGPAGGFDCANSIVTGPDGDVYVAGKTEGLADDFTVVSLTSSGDERWVYRYNGPGGYSYDEAFSIIVGSDGNLYAAGQSVTTTHYDFTILSLTESGAERWIYQYSGPADSSDIARAIVMGSDGNLYAGGMSQGLGTMFDFTVVSVTSSGDERWVYRHTDKHYSWDQADAIIMGSDGNVYAAGWTTRVKTFGDFMVVSLSADVGVEESQNQSSVADHYLLQNHPNPFHHSTVISYSLPATTEVTLTIYDITGRLVETVVNETQQPGTHQVRWDRKSNPSGVYFYSLKAGEFVETRKMVVVD